jgi:glycopeptide antibiotics resistance protein
MADSVTRSLKPRVLTIVLFVIYALLLVGVILFKFPFQYQLTGSGRELNLIPFEGSFTNARRGVGEVVENVLFFVPFGVYLSALKSGWSSVRRIIAIAAVSVAFEAIQYAFAIGRADITDVLGNTLGGAVGVGIYALSAHILKHRTTRVLNIVALVGTVVALAFVIFLRLHSK